MGTEEQGRTIPSLNTSLPSQMVLRLGRVKCDRSLYRTIQLAWSTIELYFVAFAFVYLPRRLIAPERLARVKEACASARNSHRCQR